MDNSIVIEPIKNSVEIEPILNSLTLDSMNNRADVILVKVETIQQFVTPVQVVIERKEVL